MQGEVMWSQPDPVQWLNGGIEQEEQEQMKKSHYEAKDCRRFVTLKRTIGTCGYST